MANMEKFVEAQKNLAESMVKIKNKLSEERLTRAGFDQLERNYHDSVKKLKSNHEVMMTIEPKSDDYFVKDFYGLMMNGLVKEVEEMIRSREVTVQKKSNNGSGAEGSNLGLQLERKEEFGSREEAAVGKAAMLQEKPSIRKYFFQKIERIEKRLESGEVDERDIEDSLRQLNGFYDKLLATNEIDEEVFEQYEEMTERLSIRRKVVGEQKMEKAEGKEIRSNIRLSEVRIPEFSGKIEDWESFHDLFKNLLHNSPHFSEVEKLYRLKAAIKGDAAQLIQHLKITDSNYEAAFELLKKRYENRRLMFTNLCDKILDQPVMNSDSAASIRRMLDTTKNCVMALRGMNVSTKDAEPFIARIIVRKFDKDGLRLYEQQVRKPREIQTLDDVLEFLQQQYLALEAAGEQEVNVKRIYGNKNNMSTKFCYFCEKSGHGVIECRKMLAMTPAERKPAVSAKKICFVCLLHRTDRKCNSVVRCNKCGGNHHHYLHNGDQRSVNQQVNPTSSMVIERKQQQVLLATALVKVRAATGEFELLRAMIDQGSQITSISEEASQILGLPRIKEKTEIHGLGGTLVGVSKYKVDLVIKPRFLSKHVFNSQAMVLPTIMSQQPGKSFDIDMKQWRNCMLADPFFNKSDRIDLIIGGDIYADIMEKGQKRVSGPFSQQTKLGWIVSGALSNGISKVEKVQVAATNLERFWEVEEVEAEDQCTNDDQWCMQNFEKSTVIRDDGRLMVSLPFKADMELGESKPQAMARFLNGEKKLEKYPSLKAEYITFMREYRELGHMVQVPMEMKGKYYLPHQAVIREDSRTTKVRVVFDASAKTSNQRSLNDIMHTGPKLQRDIFDIMLKWRLWKYVLTGDVEKMYRQIVVRPEDQEYQYILWRENRAEPIKQYRLTTVTYGTSAAPFLAVRSLFMIGDYCKEEMVKNIIKEDFYMDDLMTGADTVKGSQHILQSVAQQLQKFNFHLRKWISNDPKITEIVENRGRNEVISIKDDESIKTLGVGWDPNMDHFRFNVSFSHPSQMTKRKVLSLVARIFDPLGWLSPITVVAKLIVQKLWLLNIDWDETIPEEILTQWLEFANHLDSLHKIKIPRWLGTSTTTKFELHGFSDASEKAYSAVIFIKCEMRVTLLTAKSKVNPIKNKKTLPKLELCGAHLLARLLNRAEKIIGRETNVFAWTDSTITLGWIQNNRSKDKFIKNKVQDINVLVPTATWRYVGTKENPADIASRGIQPHRLMDYKLWWNGPEWLREPSSHWPELPQRTAVIASTMVTTEVNFLDDIMTRYSRFSKMRRVVAYVIRFIERTRNKIKISGGLAVHELIEAEEHILSRHQQVMFSKEIISLKRGSSIDRGSRIVGLHPFLDRRGILRVGGRLQNANMSFNQKHPIVLNKSNLTAAIVRSFHLATLHGGNRLTETSTKRKYWIIGLKAAIKKCIRSCPRCIRYKQETAKQIMGDLPDSRVTAMQPFLYTGVDYAGPIRMKCSRNRGQKCFKGYIAIFVCMSTKAIHLEAVSDLSTSAFLAALKRFFSRRGKSAKMYSDNGTNFVGAKNRLDAD
ncbi:uncharacterized protein LOC131994780 [Stomoxys calcitrans]|uniref:uncharacterized protein LOC131994780 n=1 Tax=Stomoxys calcitrans TaxID=35570 RepID=UPI0027E26E8D|nr:uncharacterized protein LOC131994780 [Stomoxys calcitrans]